MKTARINLKRGWLKDQNAKNYQKSYSLAEIIYILPFSSKSGSPQTLFHMTEKFTFLNSDQTFFIFLQTEIMSFFKLLFRSFLIQKNKVMEKLSAKRH